MNELKKEISDLKKENEVLLKENEKLSKNEDGAVTRLDTLDTRQGHNRGNDTAVTFEMRQLSQSVAMVPTRMDSTPL